MAQKLAKYGSLAARVAGRAAMIGGAATNNRSIGQYLLCKIFPGNSNCVKIPEPQPEPQPQPKAEQQSNNLPAGPGMAILGQYYDSGDQQYHSYKVTVYITKGNNDSYVGGGSMGRSETVKSILDSLKVKCRTCIVSSGKQYVKSLEGKDLYTSLAQLNLKFDNIELFLIN